MVLVDIVTVLTGLFWVRKNPDFNIKDGLKKEAAL
jgi:hypothetical protein